jgi:hypothetical protein
VNPQPFDLFESWRYILALTCTVYATIITLRWMWGWYEYLWQPDRSRALMRRYAVVQLLRIRVRRFMGEGLQIAGWSVLLVWLLSRHAA